MLAGQVHKPPDNSKKGVKGQTKPLGAGDRDRTRDNRSTKPGLYQLSYTSILSAFISPTGACVCSFSPDTTVMDFISNMNPKNILLTSVNDLFEVERDGMR